MTLQIEIENPPYIFSLQRYIGADKREIRDQQKHIDHYRAMDEELKKLEPQVNRLKDKIPEKIAQKEKIRRFLKELRQTNLVREFDEKLWYATIELVTVHLDKTLGFTFRDGTEISVKAVRPNKA